MGEGIAIGFSIVAFGLSIFVLLRPPSHSLQKDIKATVKRLEREWEDVQERMESSSGRLAKQRGLFEKAQRGTSLPSPAVVDVDPVSVRTSRADLMREHRRKQNAKQDSVSSPEPGRPDLRSDSPETH